MFIATGHFLCVRTGGGVQIGTTTWTASHSGGGQAELSLTRVWVDNDQKTLLDSREAQLNLLKQKRFVLSKNSLRCIKRTSQVRV